MVAVIHQPEYFPWLGFVEKVRRADVLVILDDVQFDRSSMQHRTRIVGPQGPFWLTIPFVHKFPQRIDEVKIADPRWRKKHWQSVKSAYGRAPGWAAAAPALEAFYAADYDRVAEVGEASVRLLLDAFAVRPARIVRSSELGVDSAKSELVLDLCRAVGARRYVAGRTGATYLDRGAFAAAGIEVEVQSFTMPLYRSVPLDPSVGGISALDAWLHAGEEAPALLVPADGARPLAGDAP